jgi:hypothetical protein
MVVERKDWGKAEQNIKPGQLVITLIIDMRRDLQNPDEPIQVASHAAEEVRKLYHADVVHAVAKIDGRTVDEVSAISE